MARDITSGFQTEIEADSINPCILVKAEFDSGDLLLWSGLGQIMFNGDTYNGAGQVLSISPVEETQALRANSVSFELSGVDPTIIALANTEQFQGRTITAWFGALDDTGLVSDPYKMFSGLIDTMSSKSGREKATVVIVAESDLIDLRAKKERRYTPEDHKAEYPGDTFFDFVPGIQDRKITWGAGL